MEGLVVAKLVSNEFIIGRSLPNGLLVNVFKINVVFDQISGQPNLQILPYMFPINSNLDYFIGMDKVICMSAPGEKLQQLYVQQITKMLQEQAQQEKNVNSINPSDIVNEEEKADQVITDIMNNSNNKPEQSPTKSKKKVKNNG